MYTKDVLTCHRPASPPEPILYRFLQRSRHTGLAQNSVHLFPTLAHHARVSLISAYGSVSRSKGLPKSYLTADMQMQPLTRCDYADLYVMGNYGFEP